MKKKYFYMEYLCYNWMLKIATVEDGGKCNAVQPEYNKSSAQKVLDTVTG